MRRSFSVLVLLSRAALAQEAEVPCDRLSLAFSVDGYDQRCWFGENTQWAETGYAHEIVETISAGRPDGAFLIVHEKPGDPFSALTTTTEVDPEIRTVG